MKVPSSRRPAALLAAMGLALTACGPQDERREQVTAGPPIAVEVKVAESVAWTDGLEVTAGVMPLRRAMPGTVLMGRVEEVLREEGDRVRAGDTLARVESREVRARLAQAEAAVAAARAAEGNALLTRERTERLLARQAASQKNVEDAVAAHDAAVANLRAAEEGVEAARMQVSYSTVTAPFAGVVTRKSVEAGDTAAPGMPLFVVEDLSRVKVEAQVPESVAASLRPGAPVEVEIAGAGVRRARIDEILPAADPASRTFTVRVELDNPGRSLRSGTFARLRFAGDSVRAVSVPESAVVRRGPLTGLFVVDEDSVARLRWVTLGDERDGRVRVLSGLREGERVIVDPPAALEDGRRVEAG